MAKPPSNTALVIFCGLLMSLSGFSTDIMLPAFIPMAVDLNASMTLVQGTIPAFVLFFAFSQLIFGPASDRFGRQPIISFGLLIFICGAILSAFGSSIEMVLAGRCLQGLGAGAAPVLARAILRDTHSGQALARAMAGSAAIFAAGPIFAPLLGHMVLVSANWRSIFIAAAIFAGGLVAYNFIRYRETNAHKNPDALNASSLKNAAVAVLTNRQSIYFLAICTVCYGALFCFITNAPLIYVNTFGTAPLAFAILFAFCGIGIVLGQLINRHLLPKIGILNMLRLATSVLVFASVGVAIANAFSILNEFLFTALMFLFNTSFLVVVSNTTTLSLDPHPQIAGTASAFFGFTTNLIGAILVSSTFAFVDGQIGNWSTVMISLTVIAAALTWSVRRNRLEFQEQLN